MSRYEQLIYENHLGKKLTFGDGSGLYVNENDLRDYNWSYTEVNDRIKKFYRKITNFKIPAVVLSPNEEVATDIKNKLMEYADEDILAEQEGKLWIGDYYLSCYITGSSKSKYSRTKKRTIFNLTVTSDKPRWTKEEDIYLRTKEVGMAGGFDYAFEYGVDYGSMIQKIVNKNFAKCDFKLIVYGPVSSVYVAIGSNVYELDQVLNAGEYAIIDSREKKTYRVDAIGRKTNIFNKRNRGYNLFAKIPPGVNSIDRNTMVDITLYYERSEPLWT